MKTQFTLEITPDYPEDEVWLVQWDQKIIRVIEPDNIRKIQDGRILGKIINLGGDSSK